MTALYARRAADGRRVLCGRQECGETLATIEGGMAILVEGYVAPPAGSDLWEIGKRARRARHYGGASTPARRDLPEGIADTRRWPPLPARVKCLRCGNDMVLEAARLGVPATTHRRSPAFSRADTRRQRPPVPEPYVDPHTADQLRDAAAYWAAWRKDYEGETTA